eukprot:Gb_41723 [translate_table: standard]
MKKEGLRGRTLTLKLKTAAFEVRTRAVSLHSFIHLRADILHHASKLLKAELPLSLRLMGLRISQFKDDKSGPSDPTQKMLTCYMSSVDSTREVGTSDKAPNLHRNTYSDIEIDGRYSNTFSILEDDIQPTDVVDIHMAHSPHKYYQPQVPANDLEHGTGIMKQDISGRPYESLEHLDSDIISPKKASSARCDEATDEWNLPNTEREGKAVATGCDQLECRSINTCTSEEASCSNSLHGLEMLEGSSKNLEFKFEEDNSHAPNKSLTKTRELEQQLYSGSNRNKDKVDLQSGHSNIMFWKDDLRCSVCGAELPTSFVLERQEHYDYHLAQILQQEESAYVTAREETRQHSKRPRLAGDKLSHGRKHVGKNVGDSQKKGKHIPIDAFFNKGVYYS